MSESTPGRGALTFRCFDLETTGTDTATCEVVQAAVVSAQLWPTDGVGINVRGVESRSQLFAARDVPPESTAVHRITDRDPERFAFDVKVIPADAPSFSECVRSMVKLLQAPDTVSVSFNGCGYDIPIVARYLAPRLQPMQDVWFADDFFTLGQCKILADDVAKELRRRHIDVMRLWLRAKQSKRAVDWSDNGYRHTHPAPLTADMFAGSLTAAHGFWLGEGFDFAHDAGVDCRATLAVLDAMLRSGFVDVERAIAWSNAPLPGDVDFDGKFKWQGDQAVIGFGKHANTPLERLPASYLRWMLDADFGADTKAMIRRYLAGEYPQRAYESE